MKTGLVVSLRPLMAKMAGPRLGGRVSLLALYVQSGLSCDDFAEAVKASLPWLRVGADADSEMGFEIDGEWYDWAEMR